MAITPSRPYNGAMTQAATDLFTVPANKIYIIKQLIFSSGWTNLSKVFLHTKAAGVLDAYLLANHHVPGGFSTHKFDSSIVLPAGHGMTGWAVWDVSGPTAYPPNITVYGVIVDA